MNKTKGPPIRKATGMFKPKVRTARVRTRKKDLGVMIKMRNQMNKRLHIR